MMRIGERKEGRKEGTKKTENGKEMEGKGREKERGTGSGKEGMMKVRKLGSVIE